MKTILTLLLVLLITAISFAQNGINYKAVIKDDAGNIIANDLIAIQFEIRQGTESGSMVYQEAHTPTTDDNGLIILNIGEGTPTPTSPFYADIDWGGDKHFLNVKVNIGDGLEDVNTTEFKFVPYALNALNSSNSYWDKNGSVVSNNTDDIGIGSDTLSAKLGVFHNSSLTDPHILLHEDGNDYAKIRMQNNNGDNYWSINSYIASNNRNDRLNFWNGEGGDVMTITGDGEVGIGVGISPKVNLHVGNNKRVLFGIDTLGNGDKLMWLPDLHAFRVGTLSTGAASVYWNNDTYTDIAGNGTEQVLNYIGLYSFASGYNTRAQGFGATAMGRDTEATNSYAMATGYFTNADGQYSTAMGFNTDASAIGSTALGYSSDAEANYSFAVGYTAKAQAIYSMAMGNQVQAQSYGSMAIGRYNLGGGNATSWVGSSPLFEIGNGTSNTSRSNAMTVLKNGRVGIGTTFPSSELHVVGEARIGSFETIVDGGNYMLDFNASLRPSVNNERSLGNSAKRWNVVFATNGTINTSDRRDKDNIRELNHGLDEIMQLRPVSYSWKDTNQSNGKPKLGLIAQDLLDVIPEVVHTHDWVNESEDSTQKKRVEAERMGVYYSDLIPVLIKAIQEQQKQITELRSEVNTLKTKVESQDQTIATLIARIEALEGN